MAALVILAYVVGLFLLAAWGDRRAEQLDRHRSWRSALLILSLAVYCTSWTFYGAVGEAARNGWDYLPIYLGPALVFGVGFPLVRKLVVLGRRHNTGSIADFLAARYGKSVTVGALATGILAVAATPYVALQLRSAETSLGLFAGVADPTGSWSLLVVLTFVAFAILFGARRADTSAGNRGLVLAIAFESVIKLGAMLLVGWVAWQAWTGLPAEVRVETWSQSALAHPAIDLRFVVITALAACAALCLPRQFHMLVVENRQPEDARSSRWGFPVYLALVALVVPPVALAGIAGAGGMSNPDAFILSIPLAADSPFAATLAVLGGFSASAGMITVTTLAVSTMLIESIAAPLLLRRGVHARTPVIATTLLTYRRIAIGAILLAAFLFHRGLNTQLALADIGLVAFAGAAQLAPALVLGLLWKRANRAGAIAGMGVGALTWALLILLPAYAGWDIRLPGDPDTFSVMTLFSLLANTLALIIAVAFAPSRLSDRLQAEEFTGEVAAFTGVGISDIRFADIRSLLEQVLGAERARLALADLEDARGPLPAASSVPDEEHLSWLEARLSRAVGVAAARILVTKVLAGSGVRASEVVALLDETSAKIRSSESARAATERSAQFYLDNVPALITFADRDEVIRFANQGYCDLFQTEDGGSVIGRPIADYMSPDQYAQRRAHIAAALAGKRQIFDIEWEEPGSETRTWQVLYQPRYEDGAVVGFFGVYQDITARRVAEERLLESYDTLEEKVRLRTAELEVESAKRQALVEDLEQANALAEAATQSKTRFLAAASHDLLQPLSAARLLTSALASELEDAKQKTGRDLVERIDQSIENADRLLRALLDISRLDARGVTPALSDFALDTLMQEVAGTLREKAALKGLDLRVVPSGLWVHSDRGLMLSVLQNLATNAVRYTQSGGVVIGARRRGDRVVLQVADTGPGIPPDMRQRIFREFERGGRKSEDERGLGLGLAIVERILDRLDHPVRIEDGPSGGSVFEVELPRVSPQQAALASRQRRRRKQGSLEGLRVLCLDNDPDVLSAMVQLLQRWGCDARGAADEAEARARFGDAPPQLAIIDYMLDDEVLGPDVLDRLLADWGRGIPAILATAERTDVALEAARSREMDVLHKPIQPATLRASLTALVTRTRQRDPETDA